MSKIIQHIRVNHGKSNKIKGMMLIVLMSSLLVTAEEISLGYFILRPHIYQDKNGNAVGPLPEFLYKYLGPEMGATFKLVNMPLARILKDMESGQLAGAALFGYTQNRASSHTYPRHNFYSMQPVIAVLKSSPLSESLLSTDLNNLSIGYVKDAIVSSYMKKNQIDFINIFGNNTWQRNVERLLKDRLDAVYTPNEVNMIYSAKTVNALDKIRIIRLPEAPIKLYSLFSNNKVFDELNLSERYDKAFKQINGAQVYKKLLEHQISLSNDKN